jgi:hypothetical protein
VRGPHRRQTAHGLRTPGLIERISNVLPSKTAQAVPLLTCVWEVRGSNLGRDAVLVVFLGHLKGITG